MMTISNISYDEELGEVVCPECKGKGKIEHNKFNWVDFICSRCQGKGKLDWCEQAVGVKPKHTGTDSSGMYSFTSFTDNFFDDNVKYQKSFIEAIDAASKQLAEDIDREILGSLKNDAEHNNEIKLIIDKRRRHGL